MPNLPVAIKLPRRLLLYFRSARHTKVRQLYYRLWLSLKRLVLSKIATRSFRNRRRLALDSEIVTQDKIPTPLFDARLNLLEFTPNTFVKFLNISEPLEVPMNWRPEKYRCGTRLWLLNLHYMEFLEALPDNDCWNCVLDWISSNDPYQQEYWLDNWNSYALSIRVVIWMQQVSARKSSISIKDKLLIKKSLVAQLRFLRTNIEWDIDGNHLVKNAKALLFGGTYFRNRYSADWRLTGERLIKKILHEQILRDGMHFELSPAYHCQVFADLMECYQILDSSPLKQELEQALTKMAQVVADFSHPDGFISLFSDSGRQMTYSPIECLNAYRKLTGKSVSPNTHIVYPASGYYGYRNDRHYVLIDCAPLAADCLPAHGHADALSFEWSVGKQRIAIDPGVYEYNAGQFREYSRSTSSHNTVTLDGADQSEFWMSFRAGRRARITECDVEFTATNLSLTGAHNGYSHLSGNPVHRRVFHVSEAKISIRDEIHGGSGQLAVARIMLHPECSARIHGRNQVRCEAGDISIIITSSSPAEIHESLCFLDFGMQIRTTQLVYRYGLAPCHGQIELEIDRS